MNQKTNSCLLCQSPSHLILNKLEGYQEGEVFQVFHCKNCNTSYSHPNKANGSLYDKIYKNGEMIPGYNRYFSYYNRIKDTNNALQFLANSEEDYWGGTAGPKDHHQEQQQTKHIRNWKWTRLFNLRFTPGKL